MNLFNQLFQNKITLSHQLWFAGFLGLDEESFFLEERVQDKKLRLLELRDGNLYTFPECLPGSSQIKPDILFVHEDLFPQSEEKRSSKMVEEVLPRPWSFLLAADIDGSESFSFSGSVKKEEFHKTQKSFGQWELALSKYELSFLVFKEQGTVFLFHFVRGQLNQAAVISLSVFESLREKTRGLSSAIVEASTEKPFDLGGFPLCRERLSRLSEAFEMKL